MKFTWNYSVDQCKSFYEQWSIDSMNTYINLPPSLPLLLSFVSVIQHSFGHILISMRFIFCVIGSKLRFYCISVYGFIMFFTFDGNKIRIHLQVLMFADTHIHQLYLTDYSFRPTRITQSMNLHTELLLPHINTLRTHARIFRSSVV